MAITYKQYEQFAGEINMILGGERMSLDDMAETVKALAQQGKKRDELAEQQAYFDGYMYALDKIAGAMTELRILVDALRPKRATEERANMTGRKKRAMISQPMAGKSDEEIAATREQAIADLEAMGYQVVDTLFSDDEFNAYRRHNGLDVANEPLAYLAMSLTAMSYCDAVYFCDGWEDTRGCVIEHQAAGKYGLNCLHDGGEDAA